MSAKIKNTEETESEYGYDDRIIITTPLVNCSSARKDHMPLLSISSPETIQKCASLPLRPNDIFICSYPKSGTTWMQHIVLSLLFQHQQQEQTESKSTANHSVVPTFYSHVSEYAPFFEIDPHWNNNDDDHADDLVPWIQENHARIGRRIFNTHLRFDMLPKPPAQFLPSPSSSLHQTPSSCCFGKFIYLVRSPLDACVSFYHHLSHQVQGGYNGSLDEFFQEWLKGDTIPFGSWLDHVQSYTAAAAAKSSLSMDVNGKGDNNAGKDTTATAAFTINNNNSSRCVVRLVDGREFFFVTYEEMCCNLPTVVADLREFLDLANNTIIDDELLQTFSFAYMKANPGRFQPKSVEWKNNFSFLRKGVPGDADMVLSKEQQEQFQTVLQKSPLWQRLLDEDDESSSSPNNNTNAAMMLLLSIIKLLVTTRLPVE